MDMSLAITAPAATPSTIFTNKEKQMGIMSMLAITVEEMLFEGATVQEIANETQLSVAQVSAYIQDLENMDVEPYEYADYEEYMG